MSDMLQLVVVAGSEIGRLHRMIMQDKRQAKAYRTFLCSSDLSVHQNVVYDES